MACAAPLDLVIATFGGGGLRGEAGLSAVFGGAAFYRDDDGGACYLGVWGQRNASRFRTQLRGGGATLRIVAEHPPARLVWFATDRQGTGVVE